MSRPATLSWMPTGLPWAMFLVAPPMTKLLLGSKVLVPTLASSVGTAMSDGASRIHSAEDWLDAYDKVRPHVQWRDALAIAMCHCVPPNELIETETASPGPTVQLASPAQPAIGVSDAGRISYQA